MGSSRIPETIPKFNDYINATDDRLQSVNPDTLKKYGIDYGFSPAQNTEWNTQRVFWRDTLYPSYTNPLTSTSVVKANVRDFMSDFREFGNPLLDKIASSDIAGNEEEAIFNIDLERAEPVRPTTPISDNCMVAIANIGGGAMQLTGRSTTDQTRASVPVGAEGMMASYVIMDAKPTVIPPANDKMMRDKFFGKAKTRVDFGPENSGKWLVVYFRWHSNTYPQFDGPLSQAHVMPIG